MGKRIRFPAALTRTGKLEMIARHKNISVEELLKPVIEGKIAGDDYARAIGVRNPQTLYNELRRRGYEPRSGWRKVS